MAMQRSSLSGTAKRDSGGERGKGRASSTPAEEMITPFWTHSRNAATATAATACMCQQRTSLLGSPFSRSLFPSSHFLLITSCDQLHSSQVHPRLSAALSPANIAFLVSVLACDARLSSGIGSVDGPSRRASNDSPAHACSLPRFCL